MAQAFRRAGARARKWDGMAEAYRLAFTDVRRQTDSMWLGSEEAAETAASFSDIADVRNWPLADILKRLLAFNITSNRIDIRHAPIFLLFFVFYRPIFVDRFRRIRRPE
jgi:hypothetical protein